MTDEYRLKNIEKEIVRYLSRRPDAADTIEGIKQWWVPRIRLEEAASEIEQAMNRLVREGKVIASTLPDGSIVYRNASQ